MKNQVLVLLLMLGLMACKQGKRIPDVGNIKVNLTTERFEQDFFAVDTLQFEASMNALNKKYPGFTTDFMFNILGTTPATAQVDVRSFIASYQSIYNHTKPLFGDFSAFSKDIKKGFQLVHYYFPNYKLPQKIISYIGPINSYACVITPDAIAIGLQLFLGKDHPLYLSPQGQSMYPAFVSRKFEPAFIPATALKNIVDDMYPAKTQGLPLVAQMIELGKRLYLLDQFLPEMADTLKTGYTALQLEACYKNEQTIWSMFIQNDFLYKSDPQITRDFLVDAPFTHTLGEGSPGNIGQFTGWQIVKKWMSKNSKASLKELMEKDPLKLFEEAKYKPS